MFYRSLFDQVVSALFLILPLFVLAWAIWRWVRTPPRIVEPAWRSYLAFAAISLAGVSSLLLLILVIWARMIGGFSFYHPALLRFYRWGFLTGLAGLLMSFVGKGKLRWPACGLSFLMVLLWFMAATGE